LSKAIALQEVEGIIWKLRTQKHRTSNNYEDFTEIVAVIVSIVVVVIIIVVVVVIIVVLAVVVFVKGIITKWRKHKSCNR
jgi:hypothetical protein